MHDILCECAPHQDLQNNGLTFAAAKFIKKLKDKTQKTVLQKLKGFEDYGMDELTKS